MKKSGQTGFTVVELLIVVIVIGIIAAVTVVGFSAAQDRARAASAAGDISKASRKAGLVKTLNGSFVTTADLLTGENAIKVGQGSYRVFSVCANAAGSFAAAAETRNGDVYYSLNGGSVTKDNALNSLNPCPTLGVTSPTTVYGGMPTTFCAGESGSCVFTGTQTIAFGSLARGEFIAQKNQTSPVSCSNTYFTDPSPGFSKACYVLQY
jgi:prepilin-type N-terminal cleavage/methylation domain-containing protein